MLGGLTVLVLPPSSQADKSPRPTSNTNAAKILRVTLSCSGDITTNLLSSADLPLFYHWLSFLADLCQSFSPLQGQEMLIKIAKQTTGRQGIPSKTLPIAPRRIPAKPVTLERNLVGFELLKYQEISFKGEPL